MPKPTHLRSLQALDLAIRLGSLKAAASALAISPAAVGQRIRTLEEYLGYDLVVRGRSGIRPTAALDSALAHLAAAFRELETVSQVLDFQRVNEIHVTADSDWAELWLLPRVDAFRRENPGTLFCVNGTGDVPLRLGAADCQVRFAPAADAESELLFHDYLLPLGSPANCARIATAATDEMLEGFPLLHLDCYTADGGGIGWPEWVARYGYRKTAPGLGIRYRKLTHALEAVFADAGFIIGGAALLASQVEAGTLAAPFPPSEGARTSHAYVVTFRAESLRREPMARFRAWLLREAATTTGALASWSR